MTDNEPLSILITAGGTRENIDAVRSITNHSTGRLGSQIADTFIQNGAKVTYVCGEDAALPASCAYEVLKIRNTAQLMETLHALLKKNVYDCVIHSMAVSDFTPNAVITTDELARDISRELRGYVISEEEIYTRVRDCILNRSYLPHDKKISSASSGLVLTLKQTPKIIGEIKTLQPTTLLVGFKLLSGVTETELVEAGIRLLTNNGCDYVLANDANDISGDRHKAILLDETGILRRANTKPEIAQMIYESITSKVKMIKF